MKKTEKQTHICSKCGKDFELNIEKGFKFSPSVRKTLKCSECAWGGPGGLKRHADATDRLSESLIEHFKKMVPRGVGCSPGPDFYLNLNAPGFLRRQKVKANGKTWFVFDFGTFEGRPITLTIEVPTK